MKSLPSPGCWRRPQRVWENNVKYPENISTQPQRIVSIDVNFTVSLVLSHENTSKKDVYFEDHSTIHLKLIRDIYSVEWLGYTKAWEETKSCRHENSDSFSATTYIFLPIAWYEMKRFLPSCNRVFFESLTFEAFSSASPSSNTCCSLVVRLMLHSRTPIFTHMDMMCIICARWVCRECLCAVIQSNFQENREPYVVEREKRNPQNSLASF